MDYIDNVRNIFNNATDYEIKEGKAWYKDAHKFAKGLSSKYNVPLETVVAVIAAISPNCSWAVNKRDAETLITAHLSNRLNTVSIATWSKNRNKAEAILRTNDIAPLSGKKVTAFYENILHPRRSQHVTIDRHAFGVCENKVFQPTKVPNITPKRHKHASDAYKFVAKETGLKPCEVQAVCWVAWKNRIK